MHMPSLQFAARPLACPHNWRLPRVQPGWHLSVGPTVLCFWWRESGHLRAQAGRGSSGTSHAEMNMHLWWCPIALGPNATSRRIERIHGNYIDFDLERPKYHSSFVLVLHSSLIMSMVSTHLYLHGFTFGLSSNGWSFNRADGTTEGPEP